MVVAMDDKRENSTEEAQQMLAWAFKVRKAAESTRVVNYSCHVS